VRALTLLVQFLTRFTKAQAASSWDFIIGLDIVPLSALAIVVVHLGAWQLRVERSHFWHVDHLLSFDIKNTQVLG